MNNSSASVVVPDPSTAGMPPDRVRVVMLVSNSCVNDTRVIRAAETVAEHGFESIVLAVAEGTENSEERRNGVLYKRIAVKKPPKVRASSAPHAARTISDVSTYALVPLYFADLAQGLASGLNRHFPRGAKYPVRILLYAERQLRRIAAKYSAPWQESLKFSQVAPEISLRVGRLSVTICRHAITHTLRFIRFRPLVDTRRMRRAFTPHVEALRPDVIHAHDLIMLPAGAAAARALGAKLVYDAHELEVHRNTNSGPIDKWLRYYLERKHIVECDAVVTVCDSIADHLAREYPIKRPTVVMNAPNIVQEICCDTDLRTRIDISRDTPLAVYVGRITVGRGIEQIVDALQYLPGYHLALVGPVNKPTVEAAQEMAAAISVADRLHVVAPVAPGMIVSFISSADVSLVPIQNVCLSYYYCLPNKLLESAIARLPVVVSNLPELKRFVEISKSGIVMDETNPRDIARAVQEAYENRDRLQPDSARLLRAEEVYGWQKQKETLKSLYASFNLLPSQHLWQDRARKKRPSCVPRIDS